MVRFDDLQEGKRSMNLQFTSRSNFSAQIKSHKVLLMNAKNTNDDVHKVTQHLILVALMLYMLYDK